MFQPPRIESVRRVGSLYVVDFEAKGEYLTAIYRIECKEIWKGDIDPDVHRRSAFHGCVEMLGFAWDLTSDEIDDLTPREIAELPAELLWQATRIALDPVSYRGRGDAVVEVRL